MNGAVGMNRAHREEVVLTQRNNMLANERFPWRRRSDPIGRKIACLVFTMKALIPVLATAIVILFFAPRAEALETLTAQDVVSWAQYGMGYSYWWGNGRWRTDKASPGSCSGSCPKCKHSGSYGADCSGFVAKVWRVPSSTPLTTNAHPYSTANFYNNSAHWSRVNRSNAKQADAMVYRTKKSGHIFLYDSKDPWGTMWSYECKGCSAGCVHNLRTATSSYVAIRRKSMVETPKSCVNHNECSSGLCAWNGDIYCCRSPGFSGKDCFSDNECPSGNVCAYNGKKFVCTNKINCGGSSPTGSAGSGGSSSSGSSGFSGSSGAGGLGTGGGAGCYAPTTDPWRYASLGPSFLLVGLAGVWRRRRRNNSNSER